MADEKIITVEEPVIQPEVTGRYISVGANGLSSAEALVEKKRKIEAAAVRTDYRECISCDHCVNSLEIRSFKRDRKTVVSSLLCLIMDKETDGFHTCNYSRRNKSGKRKIVWDLANAPDTFGTVYYENFVPSARDNKGEDGERTATADGEYRGGSKFYRRKDGDKEAVGGKKIPKGLGN